MPAVARFVCSLPLLACCLSLNCRADPSPSPSPTPVSSREVEATTWEVVEADVVRAGTIHASTIDADEVVSPRRSLTPSYPVQKLTGGRELKQQVIVVGDLKVHHLRARRVEASQITAHRITTRGVAETAPERDPWSKSR